KIKYQFRATDSADIFGLSRVETFEFGDGTVWSAADVDARTLAAATTSGNDSVYGYDTQDVLDGGTGNDLLQGGEGSDAYIFGRGYGTDTIDETAETYGDLNDTVIFADDVAVEDIQLVRSGDHLIIKIAGTTDQLTIDYQFWDVDSGSIYGKTRIENFA